MEWILVFVCLLVGIACVALPHAFTKRPDTIRLSILGIVVFVFAFVFSLFPEGMKKWMVRIFGVLIVGLGGLIAVDLLSPGTVLAKPSENMPEAFGDVTIDERMMITAKGGEYTRKVVEGVSRAKPEWIVESPAVMQVVVVGAKTLGQANWTFEHAFHNGTSEEERIQLILDGSQEMFGLEQKSMQERGTYDQAIAERRTKYAAQLAARGTAGQPGAPVAAPDGGSLEDAQRLLADASAAWRSGDAKTALVHAESAWRIRKRHLGDGHPQVLEVEKMIGAARQQAILQGK